MKNIFFIGALLIASSALGQSKLDSNAIKFFYPQSFYEHQKKTDLKSSSKFRIDPHFSLNGGVSVSQKSLAESFLHTDIEFNRRNVRVMLSPYIGGGMLSSSMHKFIDSLGVNSAFGRMHSNDKIMLGTEVEFRLNWQISKHFNAEVGRGRNFWGNGYRSMVLGNSHALYPYLKFTTKVWKFRYVNLFAKQRTFLREINESRFNSKYSALHAIDLDITKKIKLTIFESVIWQAADTLSNRGFELNYLNPIIFYRPVEFAQGSADNVLLGAGLRYLHNRKTLFYSQFFLDEFLFNNVRNSSGWWANKIGLQLGVKSNLNDKITVYTEYNLARPFTYSHGSVQQNYGHMNQSLAHPLGTNFMEWTSGIEYEKKKFILNLRFNWALYGRNINGDNYGGDIYTESRDPFRVFGNKIGQGNRHHSYVTQLAVSKRVGKKLWAYATYNWRHLKSSFIKFDEHTFLLGISFSPHKLFSRELENDHFKFSNDF